MFGGPASPPPPPPHDLETQTSRPLAAARWPESGHLDQRRDLVIYPNG